MTEIRTSICSDFGVFQISDVPISAFHCIIIKFETHKIIIFFTEAEDRKDNQDYNDVKEVSEAVEAKEVEALENITPVETPVN